MKIICIFSKIEYIKYITQSILIHNLHILLYLVSLTCYSLIEFVQNSSDYANHFLKSELKIMLLL